MKYIKTAKAVFLCRPNRFIAKVLLNGREETVHVKNTGRCKELLVPNATVILAEGENPLRKTKYDLVAVYKEGLGLINMDSLAPNQAVKEWLCTQDYSFIKPETVYGDSRFDFYLEKGTEKIFMEVKGCTLERNRVGFFPDAPTLRGRKHLYELMKAKKEGYRAVLCFVIQMPFVKKVLPNAETDPDFAKALEEAKQEGVEVWMLPCEITENEIKIREGL